MVQNGPFYVLVGDNITITSFTDINGNPVPSSSWTLSGSPLSADSRFNTDTLGQLTISSITLADAGNYTNTLTNNVAGDNMSINNTVELIVAGIAISYLMTILFTQLYLINFYVIS